VSSCLDPQSISHAHHYRAALRYAVHDSLVTAAFSGLFLLKMANLFPAELDLAAITAQVEQLAQLLSDVAAERYTSPLLSSSSSFKLISIHSYALTLRIMLANLRRKVGMIAGLGAPITSIPPSSMADGMVVPAPGSYVDATGAPVPFTMEELGFAWPGDRATFSPSAIPLWLQEKSLTDLGLPVNGSDDIFMNVNGMHGWSGDFAPMPGAW
jgi:hypothetical protein